MLTPIEIFRPGRHVAMSGETISFSEADLRAAAEAYDPSVYEAPLVVGHPKVEDPAYGWTKSLAYAGEKLIAQADEVEPTFAQMVRARRFKRVSASFFKVDAKANPKPGVYYLRHIGFLGAAAPSVQGLKPVAFAAAEEGVIEFAHAVDGNVVQQLLRSLRDMWISKFGLEEANQVLPDFWIDNVYREDPSGEHMYAAATGHQEDTTMLSQEQIAAREKELKAREDAFAEREKKLETGEAQFAERDQKIKDAEAKARRKSVVAFVEGLVKDGRLLPRHEAPMVEFMAAIEPSAAIEFAEGADDDTRVKKPSVDWLRGFLGELPQQVDYSERAGAAREEPGASVSFAAPAGYSVDPKGLALHKKALAYQSQHPDTPYDAAVAAVSR